MVAGAYGQSLEYDKQSCFNENETVQAALYETLMEEGRIDRLNSHLIPIPSGVIFPRTF